MFHDPPRAAEVPEKLQGYAVLLRAEEVWTVWAWTSLKLGRWHHCKLLSKEEQNVDTGIPLPMAAWFIFRQPHQDVFQDSSIAVLLFP
ncbi:hypothetical protein AK812_SmicGene47081, partial [Symbiodinium microadriaticum]